MNKIYIPMDKETRGLKVGNQTKGLKSENNGVVNDNETTVSNPQNSIPEEIITITEEYLMRELGFIYSFWLPNSFLFGENEISQEDILFMEINDKLEEKGYNYTLLEPYKDYILHRYNSLKQQIDIIEDNQDGILRGIEKVVYNLDTNLLSKGQLKKCLIESIQKEVGKNILSYDSLNRYYSHIINIYNSTLKDFIMIKEQEEKWSKMSNEFKTKIDEGIRNTLDDFDTYNWESLWDFKENISYLFKQGCTEPKIMSMCTDCDCDFLFNSILETLDSDWELENVEFYEDYILNRFWELKNETDIKVGSDIVVGSPETYDKGTNLEYEKEVQQIILDYIKEKVDRGIKVWLNGELEYYLSEYNKGDKIYYEKEFITEELLNNILNQFDKEDRPEKKEYLDPYWDFIWERLNIIKQEQDIYFLVIK